MKLRSSDPSYLHYVDIWYSTVLSALRPLLYTNGGPIIMAQVENEYGSFYTCDSVYTQWLANKTAEYLADDVLLFTTDGDGPSYLKCGQIPGIYATVDFGAGADTATAFAVQRAAEPKGPLVNSEFYPGWLDHWGQAHASVSTASTTKTLDEMLAMNASVNM